MNVRIAKQIGEEKELFIDVLFRLKINNIPFKSGLVIVIGGNKKLTISHRRSNHKSKEKIRGKLTAMSHANA